MKNEPAKTLKVPHRSKAVTKGSSIHAFNFGKSEKSHLLLVFNAHSPIELSFNDKEKNVLRRAQFCNSNRVGKYLPNVKGNEGHTL